MTATTCAHCGAPTTDGVILCKSTQQTARTALENIASYHGDLLGIGAVTQIRTKRSGVSDPTGSRAALELDGDDDTNTPADLAAQARTELTDWMRKLQDGELIATTVAGAARSLQRDLPKIATSEWGADFVHQILSLERRMRRVIEQSKGSWYAGICGAIIQPERIHDGMSCACACHNGTGYTCDIDGGCGTEFGVVIAAEICTAELFVTPGRRDAYCKHCRAHHDASARRETLITEMRDTLLPLTTIAHVCVAMFDEEPSVEKFTKRIKKWTDRGDLIWADHADGVRLYRVGDVLDLKIQHASDPRGWHRRREAV